MWSHYADKHKGVVIEFKGSQLQEIANNCNHVFSCFEPIRYTTKIPSNRGFDNDKLELPKDAILTEALEWSYEQEHRIIISKDNKKLDKNFIYDISNSELPKSITLGCCMDQDKKNKSYLWLMF